MTASPTPFFAKSESQPDEEHYAESASCSEAPATCAKNAQVQPASAAIPSEEDVARIVCRRVHEALFPDAGDWRPGELERKVDIYWPHYANEARAVLALFAPILAEKEREIERLTCRALQAIDEREAALARALAAEAALAGERDRCLAIVEAQVPEWVKQRSGPYWDGYREAMEDAADDIRKGAAAIRAQGGVR
ncbi:hypothetical protein DK26_15255 [Bosea sp. WAO]|uniref:hypothetical protein n=1 Tax=Bosea sp. WAO TaxID=406341 RepID=UPI00074785B6|nr:hypothetical protein [Bosea sp. WAO]KUL94362.1 hypothetical protein DK26_15255 [Bosea sp. WAO]